MQFDNFRKEIYFTFQKLLIIVNKFDKNVIMRAKFQHLCLLFDDSFYPQRFCHFICERFQEKCHNKQRLQMTDLTRSEIEYWMIDKTDSTELHMTIS